MPESAQAQAPALPLEDNGASSSSGDTVKSSFAARSSRLRLPLIILVSSFTGAVAGLYFQPPGLQAFFGVTGLEPGAGTDTPIAVATEQVMSQQQVAVVSEGDVVALGRILPMDDVISIATPYGAGDARIAELRVNVGDQVEAGDILAVLDNRTDLESALASSLADLAISEATLEQTIITINASRAEAEAAYERSQATLIEATSERVRSQSLLDRGIAARADFDSAVARAEEAALDVQRDLATLSRYRVSEGEVQADIAVAQANLEAARISVERAERNLEQSIVAAPTSGTIFEIHSREGEQPGSEGILDMGDTSQMKVEAEVYQTMVRRVALGDPVTITTQAIEQTLNGTVVSIGLEINRQSITSDDPAANTDARVVNVVIELDPESAALASGFTNLEVIVRIEGEDYQ
ncbi:efflux RND transporter periplasmic adaptor subunit [Gymnodinialimonas hymeniacidonis]|uniref:efflux RND transporter periplasmic adaptor subunit n=1 Tax=Gymnodinialimonas hymeniacidonis TaxID=3126508 RepID=UPI0034C63A65